MIYSVDLTLTVKDIKSGIQSIRELVEENNAITLALDIGKRRPDWDAAVLEKMGAVHCTVDRTLGRRILGELDLEHAPMFLVSARKA